MFSHNVYIIVSLLNYKFCLSTNVLNETNKNTNQLNVISTTTKLEEVNNKTVITVKQFNNLMTGLKNNNVGNTTHFVSTINQAIDEMTSFETVVNKVRKSRVKDFEVYIAKLEEERREFDQIFQGKDTKKSLLEYLRSSVGNVRTNFNKSLLYDSDSGENFYAANDTEIWVPNNRRIYKGRRTKIKYYPFMASVHLFGRFTCAGSIIASDLIITASSCLQLAWNNRFFRENPKFLTVRVGSTFYIGGGEAIPVLEVYFHPSYDPKTLKHNLAIMRLTRHIKFSKDNRNRVRKIAIDDHDNPLPFNTDEVLILGWGPRTKSAKMHSPWIDRLSYASLDAYDLRLCQEVYSSKYVTMKHFCAGFISVGGGACNHDVGGPGIVHGKLVGVVSFGSPMCGAPDAPTVFTKLGYYADWIEDIMSQIVPNKRKSTTLETPRTWKIFTLPTTRRKFKPITRMDSKESNDPGDSDSSYHRDVTEIMSAESTLLRTKSVQENEKNLDTVITDTQNTVYDTNNTADVIFEPIDTEGMETTRETTIKTSFIDTTVPSIVTGRGPTVGIDGSDDDWTTAGLLNPEEEYDIAPLRSRDNPEIYLALDNERPNAQKSDDEALTDDIYDETLDLLQGFENVLNSNASDRGSYEGLTIESFEKIEDSKDVEVEPRTILPPELDMTLDSEYDSIR